MNPRPNSRATALRYLVTIERLDGARDTGTGGTGGYQDIWVKLRDVRAAKYEYMQRFTPQEEERGHVVASGKVTQFRIRFCDDVDTTMRIRLGSRLFRITAVAEHGNREWLDMMATEWLSE